MPRLIDLTDPALAITPVAQSTDVKICRIALPMVAEDDKFSMSVRETIGEPAIGKLSSEGRFELDTVNNKVTIWLNEKTAKWFKGATITEATRVKTLTGTLLHENAAEQSYDWSGEIDIKFEISLGFTRS